MKKYSFLEELLILDTIKDHCESIDIGPTSQRVDFASGPKNTVLGTKARSYWDVPDYMKIAFAGNKVKNFERTVALYEGSYINLGLYTDLNDFLKQKLSSKRISKLRAYKRNLERVFSIEYAYYYGVELSDRTYSMLMDSLKTMISSRFEEKKMEHTALEDWENFKKHGQGLIASKRAAMIVIYNEGRPIHISFNYVWEKLVFGYVRGFDLDYSKFYLGFIDIMIQIEWCFKNQFHIYDLLRGNLDYKMLFADGTYLYRVHFIVPALLHKPFSLLQWIRTALKFDVYYPLKRKLGVLYYGIPFLPKKTIDKNVFYLMEEPTEEEAEQVKKNQMKEVPINPEPRENFKRAAYHFLYNSKTPLQELQVYVIPERKDVYFLKGNGHLKKVNFTNT